MPTYRVTGIGDTEATRIVEATNETEARHLAMVKRWGKGGPIGRGTRGDPNDVPTIGIPTYKGLGLDIEVIAP